jgi:hypothetical protein
MNDSRAGERDETEKRKKKKNTRVIGHNNRVRPRTPRATGTSRPCLRSNDCWAHPNIRSRRVSKEQYNLKQRKRKSRVDDCNLAMVFIDGGCRAGQ